MKIFISTTTIRSYNACHWRHCMDRRPKYNT